MKLHFDTATNVRKSLNYCANKVLTGDLDVKKANCITYLANAALASIRVAQDEVQLDHLDRVREILDKVPSVIDNED